MSKMNEPFKIKSACATLNGMNGPENVIDRFLISTTLQKASQSLLGNTQKFRAFLEIDSLKMLLWVYIHSYPKTFLITFCSLSGLKGFTIQPVAPSSRALTTFS